MRDKETVLLDILAGLASFHDGSRLGELYADLYQVVGVMLLAPEQVTVQERKKLLATLYELPKADQNIVRSLLAKILSECK